MLRVGEQVKTRWHRLRPSRYLFSEARAQTFWGEVSKSKRMRGSGEHVKTLLESTTHVKHVKTKGQSNHVRTHVGVLVF